MTKDITAYYSFGGGLLDGKALQNTLGTKAPLPIHNVDYAASGAGIYTTPEEHGLVYGFQGDTIIDQDAGTYYDTAIGAGYGLANIGYCVRLGAFRFYPLFGIGGGGIGFDLTQNSTTPTLADLRANRSNFLVHLGMGSDFHIGKRIGLTIGIRIGYVFAPFSNREGIRGTYFRFLFGGRM